MLIQQFAITASSSATVTCVVKSLRTIRGKPRRVRSASLRHTSRDDDREVSAKRADIQEPATSRAGVVTRCHN